MMLVVSQQPSARLADFSSSGSSSASSSSGGERVCKTSCCIGSLAPRSQFPDSASSWRAPVFKDIWFLQEQRRDRATWQTTTTARGRLALSMPARAECAGWQLAFVVSRYSIGLVKGSRRAAVKEGWVSGKPQAEECGTRRNLRPILAKQKLDARNDRTGPLPGQSEKASSAGTTPVRDWVEAPFEFELTHPKWCAMLVCQVLPGPCPFRVLLLPLWGSHRATHPLSQCLFVSHFDGMRPDVSWKVRAEEGPTWPCASHSGVGAEFFTFRWSCHWKGNC